VCCGAPADYIGKPANVISFEAFAMKAHLVDRGHAFAVGDLGKFGALGESWPDVDRAVHCFACLSCNERYFTWQPT
jgi:hypothetical protein